MNEQYLIGILITCLGVVLWWFFRRILTKMDELHRDLITLTVNHGERITRLEAAAGRHRLSGDSLRAAP